MAYPVRSRQRQKAVVTTNAEKSAEAEVAVLAQGKAKGRMVCNINRGCMFRYELLTRYNGRNVHDATTAEIGTISRQQRSRTMGGSLQRHL